MVNGIGFFNVSVAQLGLPSVLWFTTAGLFATALSARFVPGLAQGPHLTTQKRKVIEQDWLVLLRQPSCPSPWCTRACWCRRCSWRTSRRCPHGRSAGRFSELPDLCTFECRACGVSLFEECSGPRGTTPKTEIGSWYLHKLGNPTPEIKRPD